MAERVTPKKNANKTSVKKVTARRSSNAPKSHDTTALALFLRRNAGTIVLVITAIMTGIILFLGYRSVTAASVFELKTIDIKGTNRLSADDVNQIVRRQTAKSSVWNTDMDAIRAEIERSSWVKSAVVSRVLPDGLRVRVTERTPFLAVKTTEGNTIWVDEEAHSLGLFGANEKLELPLLINWSETSSSETSRKANRNRLQAFRDVREAARVLGIADKLQSVDVGEPQEIKVTLKIGEMPISIFLGAEDFAPRLKRGWAAAEAEAEKMDGLRHVSHLIAHEKNVSIVTKTISGEINRPVEAKKTVVSIKTSEPVKKTEPNKPSAAGEKKPEKTEKPKPNANAAPKTEKPKNDKPKN